MRMNTTKGLRIASLTSVASILAIACASTGGGENVGATSHAIAREVPSCSDGIPNGEETDTDCGGTCGKCAFNKGCKSGADCASGVCREGLCAGANASNGIKDGDETDVDCGGQQAVACAGGQHCLTAHDCGTNSCTEGVCDAASVPDAEPEEESSAGDIHTQAVIGAIPAGEATNVGVKVPIGPATEFVPGNAKSCQGGGGAGVNTCGSPGSENCCTTISVAGGGYKRPGPSGQAAWQSVNLSAFKLDKYEITQGRLRRFFNSVGGNVKAHAPAAGAGAHPKIANSGWRTEWNKRLPASWDEIYGRLVWGCAYGSDNSDYGSTTWDSAANDDKAVSCIDWYTLFAFCAWDGGRLPTDAEWGFAAMGGAEERTYGWGNDAPHANGPGYSKVVSYLDGWQMTWPLTPPEDNQYWNQTDGSKHIAPPGRKPDGRAKWGHRDLNGNVLEWMLDNGDVPAGVFCENCANVNWPHLSATENSTQPVSEAGPAWNSDGGRILRGGSFEAHPLQNTHRYDNYPVYRTYARAGGRCARD
jgi:formylglycine-generating enzyme required for sulfatase activity